MRRFVWLNMVSVVILLQSVVGVAAENKGLEALFSRANQAYGEARFQQAADGYQQLIQAGYENGVLFYNLGNAFFRLNQIGRAILNYERARLLIPRDGDLNFNLRYAHLLVEDIIPESQGFESVKLFWLASMKLEELFWGFAVLNLFFWAILLLRLYLRADWNFYLLLVFLVFWFIVGLSFGIKWYQVETDDRAVILDQAVNVLAGPDAKDTLLFKLHDGTIVNHERTEEGWHLISLPDEKRGWVKAEAIERIRR